MNWIIGRLKDSNVVWFWFLTNLLPCTGA
jgi:hypothetical protein